MLNVAAKVSEAKNDLLDGAARAGVRNGDLGNARTHTVSVLGSGMKVTGDLTGEGEFRIESCVEGSVSVAGHVIVESKGEVLGDIEAAEVVASGKVSGKIVASGTVRLEKGCRIEADVEAAMISLDEGGVVNGTLNMNSLRK
jgi:cytoskeletal protein CcmA (bactofilin family)